MRRLWPWARFAIGTIALAATAMYALLGLWSVVPVLLGTRSANLIVSDSMQSAFGRGDVVLSAPSDGVALVYPNVIVFDSSRGRTIHRIVATNPDGSYQTKGDANPSPDSDAVEPSQVRGTGRVVLPGIAWGLVWAREGRWGLFVLWVVALVGLLLAARWGILDRYDPWRAPSLPRRAAQHLSTSGSVSPSHTGGLP